MSEKNKAPETAGSGRGKQMDSDRLRLGISACLLGHKVRYDGGHQLNQYLRDIIGVYVDYIPVCPEVELGLPIPRETLRLVRDNDDRIRLVFSKSGGDITERMERWARERVVALEDEGLDGFVFKSKSPSSGMERVKVYDRNMVPQNVGVGVFARIFKEHFPLLPVEEEGRLNDPLLRENFISAIFTLKRWRQLIANGASLAGVIDFHARHKLLLLAHSNKLYREMGRLVAEGKSMSVDELCGRYRLLLMQALRLKKTVSKQVNVLQHIQGYFKKQLSADEKQELVGLIADYKQGLLPLIVPITLLNHFARKYGQGYLLQQYYLNPHPKELKLLNSL